MRQKIFLFSAALIMFLGVYGQSREAMAQATIIPPWVVDVVPPTTLGPGQKLELIFTKRTPPTDVDTSTIAPQLLGPMLVSLTNPYAGEEQCEQMESVEVVLSHKFTPLKVERNGGELRINDVKTADLRECLIGVTRLIVSVELPISSVYSDDLSDSSELPTELVKQLGLDKLRVTGYIVGAGNETEGKVDDRNWDPIFLSVHNIH
ncbi:MAG: hypothetical protein ACU843_12600 [Gammaproteobacteria bacterium]